MTEPLPTEEQSTLFDSRKLATKLANALISSAVREICFFGPNIDPVLFDNDQIVDLLSTFARQSPRAQIRFVVFETQSNIRQSHRLLPLAERLSSKIKIHIASKKHQELHKMFLLIDTKAFLFCPKHNRYEGRVDFDDLARAKELQQEFEDMWIHSSSDINSRRLHL